MVEKVVVADVVVRLKWSCHQVSFGRLGGDSGDSAIYHAAQFGIYCIMIAKCSSSDFKTILEIINDGASAYKDVIPADRWKEPYMSEQELMEQIQDGVEFWRYSDYDQILGVMGIQYKGDVTLIRHAYVRTSERKKGVGGKLLEELRTITTTPILIGTWADAAWAITFYQKHGFRLVTEFEKNMLLKKYWKIPERQIITSVVLVSEDWRA